MFERILYEVDKSEIPLSSFLWIGTIMDSFHSCGNSSLIQMSTISLGISSYNLPPPAWINSDGIWSNPVEYNNNNYNIIIILI